MSWTRAIHLIHWADTQDARHQLPHLLRKLVRATVPAEHVRNVNFPSGEQVQRSGLDGLVEVTQRNQFVPAGTSVWEAGVNKDKKTKADTDFKKRTEETPSEQQRNRVFVFVTLRTWNNKDEWAEKKKDGSAWKGVIVLDANDLEHWLGQAPAVDAWLSTLMGRRPPGLIDLARHWQGLASIAEHPLQPALFLVSREATVESLREFFQQPASSAFLRSEGWNDGIDFLSAIAATDDVDLGDIDRILVVTEMEAWRYLASSREPLVLVAASSLSLSATDVADAVANGHHVLVTGAHAITIQASEIPLPRQDRHSLYEALLGCGFDEARAQSYASGCCGSPAILKRLITRHPDRVFPRWAQEEFRTKLAPFALIGGWSHVSPEPPQENDPIGITPSPPLDLWCIEQFGLSLEEIEKAIARWSTGEEPLFIQFGNSVLVSSREDAWHLLAGSLSAHHLKKFEDVAILILDEDNPALEMEPDKRWMANLFGKVPSLSSELRRSIVETLALMSCYPTALEPRTGIDFTRTVRNVLEAILPKHASWQRWASLGNNLTLVAECDPELFLERIETDLAADSPEIVKLFQDNSQGLVGSSLHCALLWALETLAWSPEYIARATRILGQLAAQTTAVQSGNSPMKSLREIFLLWLPHTNARIEKRIEAIAHLLRDFPQVGWQLVANLLPASGGGISTGTHMPRWQPWAHGWTRDAARAERMDYASRFGDMVLRFAGTDVTAWATVAEGMLRLGGPYVNRTIERLEDVAKAHESSVDECFFLWDALRQITHRHRRFRDAPWTFPDSVLNELASIRDRIEPSSPVLRHCWLFKRQVSLPDVDEMDHQGYDRALAERHRLALVEIVQSRGTEGVHELLARSENPQAIGWTLGRHAILSPDDLEIPTSLEVPDDSRRACAFAYCSACFQAEEWAFVRRLSISNWTDTQAAILACCFPFERATWKWIADSSAEAEALYWKRCRARLREPTIDDFDYVVEKLLAAGRVFAAAELAFSSMRGDFTIDDERILMLLEKGIECQSEEDVRQANYYAVQDLISHLQQSGNVDWERLARVEWAYLPLLSEFSPVQPQTLLQSLSDNPQLFYELLAVQFRAEDAAADEDTLSEREENLARFAHDLFEQFRTIPGTKDDGTIDEKKLNAWIDCVRQLAQGGDRLSVCDIQVGRLLSNCPVPEGLDANSHVVLSAMERIGSEELFRGYHCGVRSNRGVTIRGPTTGGEHERALAVRYRTIASNCRSQYPSAAAIFDGVAQSYEDEAKYHDEVARRRRLGR